MFASAILGLWTITRLRGLRTRAQAEPSGSHAALLAMCMQLDNLDRIARYWTQGAMLLAACALAVGALYSLGDICLYAAGVAGVSWLGVAAVLAIAAGWRRRRNCRERAACQAMLRVYASPETEEALAALSQPRTQTARADQVDAGRAVTSAWRA